ncbi:hypothetical protein KSP40_PGU001208 [Platanthera guangdongensis]|uniref:PHD-type zinc finger plants domain-containing protein n=1 Tax=Platanthera guangdongensis TaxID=2320717 RepID=A0ABR2N3L9_9ASPA
MDAGAGSSEAAACAASPSTSPPSKMRTVCCMCGDLGLSEELFRCKVCLFRTQHKYCSELYPKEEACRSCNWCLREERGKFFIAGEPMSDGSSSSSSSSPVGDALNKLRLQRGVPLLQLCINPVKKLKVEVEESPTTSSKSPEKAKSEVAVTGSGRAGLPFRGRERRYKLLQEVSS